MGHPRDEALVRLGAEACAGCRRVDSEDLVDRSKIGGLSLDDRDAYFKRFGRTHMRICISCWIDFLVRNLPAHERR